MGNSVIIGGSAELNRTNRNNRSGQNNQTWTLTPSLEASAELQFLYSHLNEHLFGGDLPNCMVIYIRRKNCFGHFAPDRFRNLNGEQVAELAVNPTYLSVFGDLEACKTIAHEMAHVKHHYIGPKNRNGKPVRGGYHNTDWGDIMRSIGLEPSSTGKPGGDKTGYQMMEYIIEGGPFDRVVTELLASGFKLNWGDNIAPRDDVSAADVFTGTAVVPATPARAKNRIKYTCPDCKLNAWAKPKASLMCGKCSVTMNPQTILGE